MDEGIDFNPDKALCGGRVVSEEQRYTKHHSLAKFEFIRTCGGSSQVDLIQNYFLFLRNNCPKLGFSFATREGEIERERKKGRKKR